MQKSEYINYDGLGLAELVKKGEVSATELIDIAITLIEQHNPALNAVICKMYDYAKAQIKQGLPDGPFSGVPFLVKDLYADIKGFPTSSGSALFKHYMPSNTSELMQRYEHAGLVILGKTNLPEFGAMVTTEPEAFGATHNPWDLTRTPGGSSGGSGAAVAARLVPLAHGNDGGGSLRIPASCCGLFALKPTRGLTPYYRYGRFFQGLNVDHVLTRSVRDSAAILDATSAEQSSAVFNVKRETGSYLSSLNKNPGKLRIGMFTDPIMMSSKIDQSSIDAVQDATACCESLGHQVEEVSLSLDKEKLQKATLIFFVAESACFFGQLEEQLPKHNAKQLLEVQNYIGQKLANTYKAVDLSWACQVADETTQQLEKLLQNYDVLLTPTLAGPAVKLGSMLPTPMEKILLKTLRWVPSNKLHRFMLVEGFKRIIEFSPFTPITNITGLPATSVPLYWDDNNLPVGVHFISKLSNDLLLLQLAKQLEELKPWKDKLPPIISA